VRTRAIVLDEMPCEAVCVRSLRSPLLERAIDETAKTPAIASPARFRNPFRLVVGWLSMRRKKQLLKVPLIGMATVFYNRSQNNGTYFKPRCSE
jgi:hypothetical protein